MTAYLCERFDKDARRYYVGIFDELPPEQVESQRRNALLDPNCLRLSVGKPDTPRETGRAVMLHQFFREVSQGWLPLSMLAFQGVESYNSRPPHPRPWAWDPHDEAGMPPEVAEAIEFLRTDYVAGRQKGPGSWPEFKSRMRERLEREWKEQGR